MASLGPFFGTTVPDLTERMITGDSQGAIIQLLSFLICTIGFAFVGEVVAYFFQSKTKNRWSLFLIGAVFTSIGVQALPGAKRLLKLADLSPISVAYAQTQNLYRRALLLQLLEASNSSYVLMTTDTAW